MSKSTKQEKNSLIYEASLVLGNQNFWENLEKNKNNEREVFNDWISIIPSVKDEEGETLKTELDSLFRVSLKALLELKDKPMMEAQQWFETLLHNGASLDLKNADGSSLVEFACKMNSFEVGQMLTDIGFKDIGKEKIKEIFDLSLTSFFHMKYNDLEKLTSRSGLKWLNKNKKLLFTDNNSDEQMNRVWFLLAKSLGKNGVVQNLSAKGTPEKIESRIKLCRLILEQNKESVLPLLLWNSICGIFWENEPFLSHNPTEKDVIRKNKITQCLPKLYETIKKYKYPNENDDFLVGMRLVEAIKKCADDGREFLGKDYELTELKSSMTLFSLYGLQKITIDVNSKSLVDEQKKELSKKSLNIMTEKAQLEFEDDDTSDPELIASIYSYLRAPLQHHFLGNKDFFKPLNATPYMVCFEYMDGFPEDEKNKKIVEYLSQYPFPEKEVWLNYLNGPYTNYLNNAWKNALFLKEIKTPESKLEVSGPEKKATFRF